MTFRATVRAFIKYCRDLRKKCYSEQSLLQNLSVFHAKMAGFNDNSYSSVTSLPGGANFLSIQQYPYE